MLRRREILIQNRIAGFEVFFTQKDTKLSFYFVVIMFYLFIIEDRSSFIPYILIMVSLSSLSFSQILSTSPPTQIHTLSFSLQKTDKHLNNSNNGRHFSQCVKDTSVTSGLSERDTSCPVYSFAITSFSGHNICKKEIIWTERI